MLSLRRDVPNDLRVDVMDDDIDGSIDDDVDHVEKICDPIRQSTIPGFLVYIFMSKHSLMTGGQFDIRKVDRGGGDFLFLLNFTRSK